jgi:dephospho-CoA kinase
VIVLGLTGSAAMGKSTVAAMFRRLGVPVFDADRVVHDLLAPGGGGVAAVAAGFSDIAADNGIDRSRLAERVFADPEALFRLESILHPLVYAEQHRFLGRHLRQRRDVVVLDVPLLFESGGDAFCDAVVVVSAPALVQRQRLLARPNMTPERLAATLDRQMTDAEKRRRADRVIPTGRGKAATLQAVRAILDDCRRWRPPHGAAVRRRGPHPHHHLR